MIGQQVVILMYQKDGNGYKKEIMKDKKYYFTSIGTSGKPFFVTITISASTGKIESYFTNLAGYSGNTSAKGLKISLDSINYIK